MTPKMLCLSTCWAVNCDASTLGPFTAFGSTQGLVRVIFCAENEVPSEYQTGLQSGNPPDYLPVFIEEMNAYFGGNLKIFNTPVDWNVLVPFDRTVLSIVGNIPYGMVDTYGQIAEKMGLPFGARAIGGVMARNPLPIILPCHRVIGADGHLRGYGGPGGISTKKWLLQLEGVYLV